MGTKTKIHLSQPSLAKPVPRPSYSAALKANLCKQCDQKRCICSDQNEVKSKPPKKKRLAHVGAFSYSNSDNQHKKPNNSNSDPNSPLISDEDDDYYEYDDDTYDYDDDYYIDRELEQDSDQYNNNYNNYNAPPV